MWSQPFETSHESQPAGTSDRGQKRPFVPPQKPKNLRQGSREDCGHLVACDVSCGQHKGADTVRQESIHFSRAVAHASVLSQNDPALFAYGL